MEVVDAVTAVGTVEKVDHLQELKQRPQWVCWKAVPRSDGGIDKPPYQTNGQPASHSDPSTWCSYEQAVQGAKKLGSQSEFIYGVGYVVDNDYVGVDFDHCIKGGMVLPKVQAIIDKFGSYTEITPSGDGLRTWVKGIRPADGKFKRKHVEMYGTTRFFTVTEKPYCNVPIVENPAAVQWLLEQMNLGDPCAPDATSTETTKSGLIIKNDSDKFDKLMKGDWQGAGYVGVSEAVQGLLCILALKSNCDPKKMDAEFRVSGMYTDHSPHGNWTDADKWDRLGKSEIAKAIKFVQEQKAQNLTNQKPSTYIKGGNDPLPDMDWRSQFVNDEQMSDEPLVMLIENFILEECATFIAGLSGHAKTLIAMSISKSFVYGIPLFGYEKFKVLEQLPVLYLIPESGEKSFKLRMKKFGLTEKQIFAATGKHDMFLVRTFSQGNMLALDDERLLQAAKGRIVILDTAIRFTDSDDENSAAENKFLATAIFILLKRGARSVIGLHHSPKTFEKAKYMCLENAMRGSGDLGAMLGVCYGVKMLDKKTVTVLVENIKPRDFEPCEPFQLQGRPHIDDTGNFVMTVECGQSPSLEQIFDEEKNGGKYAQACVLYAAGKSINQVKEILHVGYNVAKSMKLQYEGAHKDDTNGGE